MHLTLRESNRSVVSLQVCVELTRPGAHFISPQLMARSINAFICYYDDDDNNHHHHHHHHHYHNHNHNHNNHNNHNNHKYNKILKSDWLSTVLISALIGQLNSTVRVIPK